MCWPVDRFAATLATRRFFDQVSALFSGCFRAKRAETRRVAPPCAVAQAGGNRIVLPIARPVVSV
ncbi:hypothetical protein BV911_16535 [Pseudoruegeria sp. SK021]|nr:hypothetical protein BV911_16535 [Pseudoruegeria sp. SK021]